MKKSKTFGSEYARLLALSEKTPASVQQPSSLPVKKIKLAPEVFQHRIFGHSERHIKELSSSLAAKDGDMPCLAPILVMAIGNQYYCVDGHHRLMAYQASGVQYPVEVEYFQGSLAQAVAASGRANSRDKLPMERAEKLEAAWRLVILNEFSKKEIMEHTGVAYGTVGNMRQTYSELADAYQRESPSFLAPNPAELSWNEARNFGKPETERNEDWEDQQVQEWANRLREAFGTKWGRMPELAARAIEEFSPGLPDRLVEYWVVEDEPGEEPQVGPLPDAEVKPG